VLFDGNTKMCRVETTKIKVLPKTSYKVGQQVVYVAEGKDLLFGNGWQKDDKVTYRSDGKVTDAFTSSKGIPAVDVLFEGNSNGICVYPHELEAL